MSTEGVPSAPRPRVLLDLATLVPGAMGGTEAYARELARGLALDPNVDVRCVAPARVELEGQDHVLRTRTVAGAGAASRLGTIALVALSGPARRAAQRSQLSHYPLTVPVPLPRRGTPYVVTLHDVQHLDLPQLFSPAERAYRRFAYDAASRHAAGVITISEFSKRRIVERLNVPADRVHVAHLGQKEKPSPRAAKREDFVLYPARVWPHKNHRRLIAAIELLRAGRRPTIRLVLTGTNRQLPSFPKWVEDRGIVSRGDLSDLYDRAAVMAFPSLYEGFGLPALEAMAHGCPVAVARRASLPEICGDAAEYFDPEDVSDIASAIDRAITHSTALGELGRIRATKFTWDACIESHVRAYNAVLKAL